MNSVYTTCSLVADKPLSSVYVPGAVTEHAFAYVKSVRSFMDAAPQPPPEDFYVVDGVVKHWTELQPPSLHCLERYQDLQQASIDPVFRKHVTTAADRSYVGTAALMHKFFSEQAPDRPARVLVVGPGKGADLRRIILSRKKHPLDLVHTVDISDVHATTLRLFRASTTLPGKDFVCDVLSPDSPLFLMQYDLILVHMCLHYVCPNEARLKLFLDALQQQLSPGGHCVGTYPVASQARVLDGIKDLRMLTYEESAPDCPWGVAKIEFNEKVWRDPQLPPEILSVSATGAGLSCVSFWATETSILHKEYIPKRMEDFHLFPDLAYFRAFSLSKFVPVYSPEPSTPWSFTEWMDPDEVPHAVEECEERLNWGLPLVPADAPWILHTASLVKVKENGVMALIVAHEGRLYYRERNKPVRLFACATPGSNWAVQVEAIRDKGPIGLRFMLSDPLFIPGVPDAAAFSARLAAWTSFRASDPYAQLVNTGTWLPATRENFEKIWKEENEGVCFQYCNALAIAYKSGNDTRGSMRHIKKIVTVDIDPGATLERKLCGRRYVIHNPRPFVAEYALHPRGEYSFVRLRRDKSHGNTDRQLSRLENLMSRDTLVALLEARDYAPPAIRATDRELTDPELVALLLHTGSIVGELDAVRFMKEKQRQLRIAYAQGILLNPLLDLLRDFGWYPHLYSRKAADFVLAEDCPKDWTPEEDAAFVDALITGEDDPSSRPSLLGNHMRSALARAYLN